MDTVISFTVGRAVGTGIQLIAAAAFIRLAWVFVADYRAFSREYDRRQAQNVSYLRPGQAASK